MQTKDQTKISLRLPFQLITGFKAPHTHGLVHSG